jgi:DNA-binding MarR family transcriptional regulator
MTTDVVNNVVASRRVREITMAERRPARRLNGSPAAPRGPASSRRNGAKPVELGVLDGHLGYFLRRAQVFVFQDFIRSLALIDMRPAQYSVLVVIGGNRGLSQSDVAQLLGIERARLVRLLDRLEKRGLTRRLPSPHDRRSHVLELTRQGQKVLHRAKALAAAHESRLSQRLGPAHHKLMLEALRDFEM